MINAKELYYSILNDERLTSLVEDIFDSYPETIETFPCVVFQEENQSDIEFADNQPIGDDISVQIHIFTKAIASYPTTSEIGLVINTLMHEYYFSCRTNREVPDVEDNIRHRVMTFGKALLS